MADTFDLNPSSLPTVTKALRLALVSTAAHESADIEPLASTQSNRALLDAVYALEKRLITAGF